MHSIRKKITLVVISVILILGISVTAIGINMGRKPDVQSGEFKNLIADRISVTVENTDFVIKKASEASETFTLTFYLTAKKTQADFYGVINSLSLEGIAYNNIVFTALTPAAENKTLSELVLTASDGEPDEYRWQVDVTLTFSGKGKYIASLNMDYTSGMNKDSSVQKLMEIPLTITVQ